MTDKGSDYLSAREAAACLGLSTRTLDRYRVSGDGPVFLRFGGRVRYLREDIDAWARTRRRKSTSDDGAGDRPGLPAPDSPGSPASGSRSGRPGRARGRAKVPGSGEPVPPDRGPGQAVCEPEGQPGAGDPAPGAAR